VFTERLLAYKREEVLKLSRRHLAAAGALALVAPTLIRSAHAQSPDEVTVKQVVEELRTALIKQDKAKLDSLTAEQLSYSHSDARLQNKAEFIDGVMTRKGTLKSLEWPNMTVQVVGNNAVVRHLWVSESELDGKITNTKIGVLQVWQKQDGGWKLLARASWKLPTPA
jgi:ketosteroid isomerase-like protein